MNDQEQVQYNRGVNTFGQPIIPHGVAIKRQYTAYMKVIDTIREYLGSKEILGQPANWKEKRFAYLCIKPYCRAKGSWKQLIPAEFGITVFSFDEGVLEMHAGFIDPGAIPFGEVGETRLNCEINGFPYPGKNSTMVNSVIPVITPDKLMTILISLSNKYGLFTAEKELLYFTVRTDVPVVRCCLNWIFANSEIKKPWSIVSFEILLKEMSVLVDDPENTVGVIKHEGGAGHFIYNTRYDFSLQLGCKWHQHKAAVEKLDCCVLGIANKRVYNALFYLCHLFERELTPVTHQPSSDHHYCPASKKKSF